MQMSDHPWVCPSCNRGVAPGVKFCDHGKVYPESYKDFHIPVPNTPLPLPYTAVDPFRLPWYPIITLGNTGFTWQ